MFNKNNLKFVKYISLAVVFFCSEVVIINFIFFNSISPYENYPLYVGMIVGILIHVWALNTLNHIE